MIKLWQFLMHGCWHRWEEVERRNLNREDAFAGSGTRVYCRCTKCGHQTKFDLI